MPVNVNDHNSSPYIHRNILILCIKLMKKIVLNSSK